MERKKILIIDDEPDILTFLSALLEDHSYVTCVAKDGEEGLVKIHSENPDLICLDLLMANKSGVKLNGEIRKDPSLQKIPVIMITAFGSEQYPGVDFKRFIHTRSAVPPPDDYLEKPIDKDTLLATIANIFASLKKENSQLRP